MISHAYKTSTIYPEPYFEESVVLILAPVTFESLIIDNSFTIYVTKFG